MDAKKKSLIVEVEEGETEEQAVARHTGKTPATAQQPVTDRNIRSMALLELCESESNPRKDFGDLKELAASIAKVGVLQPIVARVINPDGGDGHLEIVFGHRRFRAAKKAGLDVVPVDIRDLSDLEVAELQLTENLQREDLSPLELAAGYKVLHETHGIPIDDIAKKVGKSKASVYAALKLNELSPVGRKFLEEGKLTASTALLVARIPDRKLQEQAAKDIATDGDVGDVMPYRQAVGYVQREYMLELKGACFPVADAQLVPAAGACGTCPKRTGAQPELFFDVKSADVCTDSVCYRGKESAWWKQMEAASKAGGQKVVPASESKRLFTNWGDVERDAPYVKADAVCYDDLKRRTFKQLLGRGGKAHLVLARDDKGKVHELISKDGLTRLMNDAELIKRQEKGAGPNAAFRKQRQAEKKKVEQMELVQDLAMQQLVVAAEQALPDLKFWRLLASALAAGDYNERLRKRRGLEDTWETKWLPKLDVHGLKGVVLELALQEGGAEFEEGCTLFKVDLKKIEAEVKERAKAAAKQAKAAPAKPVKVKKGTCRKCGCTEDKACEGGCAWTDKTNTLCTACEEVPF